MLQVLLSEWIVRIFLLYFFVVGGIAIIRHQQQAVSRPFVFFPLNDVRERWAALATWKAAPRARWWDKYCTRDNSGIRIGRKERRKDEFCRHDDELRNM